MPGCPRCLSCLRLPALLLAMVALSGCLAGCGTGAPPDGGRAAGAMPVSMPRPVSTATPTVPPLPTATPTPTPTFVHVVPSPTPTLTLSGTYDNRVVHTDGRYELELSGTRVAATFSTSRSPVEHWERAMSLPLFTVPAPFRPSYPILRTVEGRPVHADGTPDPVRTSPRRFLLRVDPDGGVHYVDDVRVEGAGHLAYVLHTVWGTTPAANDRAILEILDGHWFGKTVLSRTPPPVQREIPEHTDRWGRTIPTHKVGPFVALNKQGRVTALGVPDSIANGYLLAELGELQQLEELDLSHQGQLDYTRAEGPGYLESLGVIGQVLTLERAQELYLDGGGLVGDIPSQLGRLSRLRHLKLNGHYLAGSVPPELGRLVSLETLNLSGNLLTGDLPRELVQLSRLRILGLSDNWLTGSLPPEWSQLANLSWLSLGQNRLTGSLPPEWGQLIGLQTLLLNDNRLTGSLPPEWGQLTNLSWLYLYDNQLTGPLPPEWGQLTNLSWLSLGQNQLTGSLPPEWGQLTNLSRLSLGQNRLTGSLPPEWGQLTSLRVLSLYGNQLTGCLPFAVPHGHGTHIEHDLPSCPPTPP